MLFCTFFFIDHDLLSKNQQLENTIVPILIRNEEQDNFSSLTLSILLFYLEKFMKIFHYVLQVQATVSLYQRLQTTLLGSFRNLNTQNCTCQKKKEVANIQLFSYRLIQRCMIHTCLVISYEISRIEFIF